VKAHIDRHLFAISGCMVGLIFGLLHIGVIG
jgi:hypothetical protein